MSDLDVLKEFFPKAKSFKSEAASIIFFGTIERWCPFFAGKETLEVLSARRKGAKWADMREFTGLSAATAKARYQTLLYEARRTESYLQKFFESEAV